MAFCSAPLHKNRAVRGCGVFRASGALHTLRVHSHPCHKTKKEKKTFTFSSLFLHGKPVIRRVFYFYRASGCLKSLKRFFTSCCFNQRHLNYRSFVNPTLVFFERKSFFLQKLLILAHGFHQFFVYNL